MWQWLSSLDANGWTAVFTGIGMFAIVFAAIELRTTSKALQLDGAVRFLDELEKAKEARVYVYNELPSDPELLANLSEENHKQTQAVIDALNRIGLLIENRLVSNRLAFSIAHSVYIRVWFKLKPYADYWQSRIGGRYARRLERLDRRAKLYHDISPQHRDTVLQLSVKGNPTPVVVYKTQRKTGAAGQCQRVVWWLRRVIGLF